MRRFFDYINNNVLFKVTSLNSASVIVRIISVVIAPSLIFLITFVGSLNQKNFAILIKTNNLNFIKEFSASSKMTLISTIALPLIMIEIRNYITNNIGMQEVGFWE